MLYKESDFMILSTLSNMADSSPICTISTLAISSIAILAVSSNVATALPQDSSYPNISLVGSPTRSAELSSSSPSSLLLNEYFSPEPHKLTTNLGTSQAVEVRPTLGENNDRLKQIAKLGENWNGYGASPIPNSIIEIVQGLLCVLPIQPEIFPTARPSIQLEYDTADRHIEFEITEEKRVLMFFCAGDVSIEKEISLSELSNYVKRFYTNGIR